MANTPITGEGRKPRLVAPPKSCETHSHIYGPYDRYPPWKGGRQHVEASVEAYLTLLARLGMERCVIVQPSGYGPDNRRTVDAIREIGLHRARGVAVTRPDVETSELKNLHEAGIRGMRFMLVPYGYLGLDVMPDLARRIAPLGWHVQVQGDGSRLPEWLPILKDLPCDVVVDHISKLPPEHGVGSEAFTALLRFVETGKCWVKLSAPYYGSREGPPRYSDMGPRVEALVAAHPDRMVWAANWPNPSLPLDNKPEEADFLDVLLDWVSDEATRKAILVDNPARLYDFGD